MTTATPSFAGGIGFATGFRINPSLTGNTNNWDPTGLISASLIAISSDGAYDLTGIVASTIQGRFIWLHNASAHTITLKYNSASSTAGNRFLIAGGSDASVATKTSLLIMYSTTDAAWLVSTGVSSVAGYTPGGTDVAVADGGTGSSTAAGARTNLGLGTIATQNYTGTVSTDVDALEAKVGTGVYAPVANEILTGTGAGTSQWLPPFDRVHDHSSALDGTTLSIQGGLNANSVITASQLTANISNWTSSGMHTAVLWRLSADSTIRTITGIEAPPVDGAFHVVECTAGTIILSHDSAASVAANRIYNTSGSDMVLTAGTYITIMYDGVSNRWVVIGALAYLEGTFTPVGKLATMGTASFTPTIAIGRYTRRGNLVSLRVHYQTSAFSVGTGTGSFFLEGNPYTPKNVTDYYVVGTTLFQGYTKANYTQVAMIVAPNDANLSFNLQGSGQAMVGIDAADLTGGNQIRIIATIEFEV